ncbi:MAG: hypothetical protein QXN16_00535 [Candidatus Micrarchaeaceae archaeon]
MGEIINMSKKSGKTVRRINNKVGEIFSELSAETGKKANRLYTHKRLKS